MQSSCGRWVCLCVCVRLGIARPPPLVCASQKTRVCLQACEQTGVPSSRPACKWRRLLSRHNTGSRPSGHGREAGCRGRGGRRLGWGGNARVRCRVGVGSAGLDGGRGEGGLGGARPWQREGRVCPSAMQSAGRQRKADWGKRGKGGGGFVGIACGNVGQWDLRSWARAAGGREEVLLLG